MIAFVPKPNAATKTKVAEESRFDRIRRLADKHRTAAGGYSPARAIGKEIDP
ncbi:hypothetical protein NKJ70_09215 [Mesorhizobium sp. M0092]|uniref:hypothetical protein n=1 Tax=unclassified Mesorhizobium TaxID=325217 RepID=UPI003335CDDF